MVTISDKKLQVSAGGVTVDYYTASVVSATDYYPGGMDMPGRQYNNETGYRYGFNGKEKDNKDGVIQYDYGFRIYDPRLVRFKSVDPLSGKYPYYTPYQFAGNKPIWCIDLDGLEDIPTNGGSYWSVERLKQVAMNDVFYKEKAAMGQRVILNLSYVAIANDDYNKRQTHKKEIVLNEGTVGSNISGVNLEGTYFEDGRVGAWGMPNYIMTYSPNVGTVLPPETQPQNPPNPPIEDGGGIPPNTGKLKTVTETQTHTHTHTHHHNRYVRASLDWVPATSTLGPSGSIVLDNVAGNAPNGPMPSRSPGERRNQSSIVTITLRTTNLQPGFGGRNDAERRAELRRQLRSRGIPNRNIMFNPTQYGQDPATMRGNVNQVIFNTRTTTTTNTTTTTTTTTTKTVKDD